MNMVRILFGLVLIVLIWGYLIYSFIKENGFLTRKKLLNSENAKADAVIEKIEPVIIGSKRNKHYEIEVIFSDGTSYRDIADIRTPGYMKYTIEVDKKKIQPIIDAALTAHKEAVQGAVRPD